MRINQVYLSQSLHQFESFKKIYSLESYTNKKAPTVFYGLYTRDDFIQWRSHSGFKVLICGYPEFRGGALTKIDTSNLNFLAYDEYWECLAISHGIKNYRKVRFAWQDIAKCKPVPLGDKIYIHFGGHSKAEDDHFDKSKFIETFGDELIYPTEWVTNEELINDYYSKSFIHIITSPLPIRSESTAQSLGLMGVRTLSSWPSLNPSYEIFNISNTDELIRRVNKEKKKIGTTQSELAQKCMEFFDFSDDWLYEDYWK
jgi:hypothetical protein